jgi:hypothetical protein
VTEKMHRHLSVTRVFFNNSIDLTAFAVMGDGELPP